MDRFGSPISGKGVEANRAVTVNSNALKEAFTSCSCPANHSRFGFRTSSLKNLVGAGGKPWKGDAVASVMVLCVQGMLGSCKPSSRRIFNRRYRIRIA